MQIYLLIDRFFLLSAYCQIFIFICLDADYLWPKPVFPNTPHIANAANFA